MTEVLKEKGRYFMEDGKGTVAEMTYSEAGAGAWIVDSTFVRDDYRGQGIGRVLLDSVVADARAQGRRIMPLCPYAKAQFDKHPELYADVRAG